MLQKKIKIGWAIVIVFFVIEMYPQKTKVACIGDSVTYGLGIKERDRNSYPAQLQQLLGDNFEAKNFGASGATVLKNGHKPYWNKSTFDKSKAFAPDIVIIYLGLNDQGLNNWPKHKDEFEKDYLELINIYKSLPSKPKVIICKMSPTLSGHHWFEEGMRENFKEIQSKIEAISLQSKTELIDLHEPLYRFPEYFPDNLHPTKEGAAIIANKVYSAISGDYGGLQLPKLYGEKMVLQRNEPIEISGIANGNDEIKVTLNKVTLKTTSKKGVWKVTYPPMNAGGPFKLNINSKLSQNLVINEVYIGDVWLASGQSNMDFKVHQMKSSKTVLKDSLSSNIFIFSMDPKVLGSTEFTKEEFEIINANDFFNYSGWSNSNDKILEDFSAVAYSFAYNLQKKLNIPIGIVCNAVGGSPTQSWISREQMGSQHETISLLNDTWQHPSVNSWVSKRKIENFGGNKNLKTRHPYDPTILFDAGIKPILDYNITGVIWYQGESNTNDINLHSNLFELLVNDWRTQWNKPNMPFYFAQLSSIDRANLGAFRDSQRKSLLIPNTGMAVSLDVGHETDVHPNKKWIIGERLSKIALVKTYKKDLNYSGPLLDYVNVVENKLEVYFKYGEGLKTKENDPLKDIQIAGKDGIFISGKSKIENDKLIIWSSKIKNPRFVRYGYTSFSNGNLVNRYNLPASTFSNQ